MRRTWSFLPEAATPFMLAALNPPAAGDTETLGRDLLRLVFGPAVDSGKLAAALTEDELRQQAFEVFESDPAVAARAVADIAAFYRGRADAGDVQALVELGRFLYWDEPQAARAAYQEATDGGHRPALIDLGMVLAKRVYEVRYLDTSLLAGSAPRLSTTAGVRVGDSWVRLLWRELF